MIVRGTKILALLLFSIILLGITVENTIGNSFAQEQQLQPIAPSTISMRNSQPLCKAGICNTNSMQKNNVDPTTKTLTQTFTNTKIPTLSRTFTGTRTLGPDTFRFINSFWTSPPINDIYKFPSNAVGTGNCPSNFGDFTAAIIVNKFLNLSTANGTSSLAAARAFPWLPLTTADTNVEVGHGDIAVLAILLQYQGNVKVHGLTAALKLPPGFVVWGQGYKDNYPVAFSNYNSEIDQDNAIVLCFGPLRVLPKVPSFTPIVGTLGLHYLIEGQDRTIVEKQNAQQLLMFMRSLKLSDGQNMTTFTNSLNPDNTPTLDFENTFTGNVPSEIVNQVTPVVFQITGQTASADYLVPDASGSNSDQNLADASKVNCGGNSKTFKIVFDNIGDVPITDLMARASTTIPADGPSLITHYRGFASPSVTSLVSPIAIIGPNTFRIGTLQPGESNLNAHTFSGSVTSSLPKLILRNSMDCNTAKKVPNSPVYIESTYINSIGQRFTELNQLNVPTN